MWVTLSSPPWKLCQVVQSPKQMDGQGEGMDNLKLTPDKTEASSRLGRGCMSLRRSIPVVWGCNSIMAGSWQLRSFLWYVALYNTPTTDSPVHRMIWPQWTLLWSHFCYYNVLYIELPLKKCLEMSGFLKCSSQGVGYTITSPMC